MTTTVRAIAYTRVSTSEQGDSGLGLDAQRAQIDADLHRRGWVLADTVTDIASGKSLDRRPALADALDRLDRGEAEVLIVAKLDRLARSVVDFAGVLDRSARRGWRVVCLDLGIDTSTPSGEMLANVVASFAQYERKLIGARTRDALAVKKGQGHRLGRPVSLPEATRQRIAAMRAEGMSLRAIVKVLDSEGVPTPRGGERWTPWGVRRVCDSVKLDADADAARARLAS